MAPGAEAAGVTSNCNAVGDAAPGYEFQTCQSICSQSATGETWTCDLSAVCAADGAHAYIVHDYDGSGTHDFNFWGGCAQDLYCCTFDDTAMPAEITKVTLIGGALNDELAFTFPTEPSKNLRNHTSAHLDGFIYGGADNDVIDGSYFVGNTYRDNLYGESGPDVIHGNDDGDWISGGSGDDILEGGLGDDRMVGGGHDDVFRAGVGHDTLCDSSGADGVCATNQVHEFYGGDGDDVIWYGQDAGCATRELDSVLSDGGNGTNNCGDDVWGAALPLSCFATVMSEPPACADPN